MTPDYTRVLTRHWTSHISVDVPKHMSLYVGGVKNVIVLHLYPIYELLSPYQFIIDRNRYSTFHYK